MMTKSTIASASWFLIVVDADQLSQISSQTYGFEPEKMISEPLSSSQMVQTMQILKYLCHVRPVADQLFCVSLERYVMLFINSV